MTKVILASTVAALLLLTGCSKKGPLVDESASKKSESSVAKNSEPTEVQTDVETEVVPEESMIVNDTTANNEVSELSINDVENKFSSVQFAFDKFNIQDSESKKIDAAVEIVNADAKNYSVKLEGNCDEWGSDEYNFALGLRRANSVKKAMVNEGVDASRIVMVSYGESNPKCQEKTESCWSENRRVDFKLLP